MKNIIGYLLAGIGLTIFQRGYHMLSEDERKKYTAAIGEKIKRFFG